jgi:hypothetical protein
MFEAFDINHIRGKLALLPDLNKKEGSNTSDERVAGHNLE